MNNNKYKWVLYPKRDFRGDGSIVANCYLTEDEECPPICTIRSYSKYYRVEVVNIKSNISDIRYDNVELSRLNRKLLKKRKKGKINSEQHSKIILQVVCNMVECNHLI